MILRIRLFMLLAICLVALPSAAQIRILAYGDSNTWGWKPVTDGNPIPRYTDSERWPGVMQHALGTSFKVEVNGLIGRTLAVDLTEGIGQLDGSDHNGTRRLAFTLAESSPVHFVVVMLGTNDLIEDLHRSPEEIAKSLIKFVEISQTGTTPHAKVNMSRVLIVVPPALTDTSGTPFKELFGPSAIEKSKLLAAAYERIAAEKKFFVFDAGTVVKMDGVDGLHLSRGAHKKLGEAIAKRVRQLLLH